VISSLGEVSPPRRRRRSLPSTKRRPIVTATASNDWKELASRECDGLVVALSWSKAANRVEVKVADRKLGEELHLSVPSPCALDAFYHPFAYASGRGLCLGEAMCESLDLQLQS
jgi:hypothetical protein